MFKPKQNSHEKSLIQFHETPRTNTSQKDKIELTTHPQPPQKKLLPLTKHLKPKVRNKNNPYKLNPE